MLTAFKPVQPLAFKATRLPSAPSVVALQPSTVRFGRDGKNDDRFSKQAHSQQPVQYVELTAPNPTVLDNLPIDNTEVVVFDLETTGLLAKPDPAKPDETVDDIIEISAIRYKNGVEIGRFHTLLKPGKCIPDEVVALTGITNEMVQKDGVDTQQALQGLADFVGENAVLIGHNARWFDVRFVRAVCARHGLEELKERFNYDHVVDTLELARKFFVGKKKTEKPENMKLTTVSEFFGIRNAGAHRAQNDVEAAAKLYIRFVQEIRKQGVELNTFGDLFRYQFTKRKVKVSEPTGQD